MLDVGCGTGTTTFEIGRLVQPGGSVVGVDVSRPPDEVTLGPAGDLDELARQALEQNPLIMTLPAANPHAREAAVEAAATALGDHVQAGDVRLGAGTWLVEAFAPGRG